MSWMKRPRASPSPQQPPGPAPPASHLPHQPQMAANPNQQWQQSPPNDVPPGGYPYGNVNSPHQMQQHYWQQPPQNANQQNAFNHNFNQQNFPQPQPQTQPPFPGYQYNQQQYANPNSNAYSLHQQNYNAYNQPGVPNQQYNASQVHPQQNFPTPRNNYQGSSVADAEPNESDPWNWGWEDNTAVDNQNTQKAAPSAVPNVNANVLNDSFTNSVEGWNYCAPEQQKSDNHQNVNLNQMNRSRTSSRDSILKDESNTRNPIKEATGSNEPIHFSDNASLGKEVNLGQESGGQKPLGKIPENKPVINKTHIGNIPHGWSTESQPSQESSDGLLSHTESTTGSEDQPRGYDKNNLALSANDNTNFNYVQPSSDFFPDNSYNRFIDNTVPNAVNTQNAYLPDDNVNQELVDSINTLHIGNNVENMVPNKHIQETERLDAFNPTSEETGNANLGHNLSTSSGRDSNSPNLPIAGLSKPPVQLPPVGNPPQGNTNPFKRAGQISHRAANKNIHMQVSNTPPLPVNQQPIQDVPFQQDISNINMRQPSPLTHVDDSNSTNRIHHANLETTPDNSERPDNPSPVQYPQQYAHNLHQPLVENCEIAPNNDRNEYLQTGHLSEAGFNDNMNYRDNMHTERRNNPSTGAENFPPPGLRRMVLGQPESQFNQNSNFAMDEPPPGLSRMVPGHPAGALNMYNQSNDYLDRQVDGQTTESDSLTNSACMAHNPTVYRQVDGQPTDDESNYNQNMSSRSSLDRRPVGFDRMVPGEASNSNFNISTFQNQGFSGSNEERIVTGFGHLNSTETREQNMDGSDYSEVDTNQVRNVVGATESSNDSRNQENASALSQNITVESDLQQRDRDMEGENLQDLSTDFIASTDFSMIRDQNLDGADTREEAVARKVDQDSGSDRIGNPKPTSNQQLPNDIDRKYRDDTTGDESERDRMYKMNSLRKEKENSRMRTSRERDNRYNDRREDRRSDKDRRGADFRGERDSLRSDDRYFRKNRDHRYDTEDTDYYSDRDRRRYREGSYSSSKPPRPEDRRRDDDSRKSYERSRDDREKRRRDDPDRDRRYDSYESERDGNTSRRREKDRDYVERDDDRHRRYGTAERDRNYPRKERGSRDDRKRNDGRYKPSRPDSRDPDPTEDEPFDENTNREHRRDRRGDDRDRDYDRDRRSHRHRRDRNDQYYERYGYPMDPYSQHIYQQQTLQYYEKLRVTNPQAYLEIYNKYMTGAGQNMSQSDVSRAMSGYSEVGYTSLPNYDPNTSLRLGEDRGSVHSGRSSANGEAIKDRMVMDGSGGYYYPYRRIDNPTAMYLKQDTPTRTRGDLSSVRTDYSGSRDFNTDASLNLFLEDLTVKSERLTPVKFATVHIKGDISSSNLVVINPSYPSDGQPAVVEILNINKVLANDPIRLELFNYPGPLIKGTTHKKTVIEFCEMKIKTAIERYTTIPSSDKGLYPYQGNVNQIDKNTTSHITDLGSIILMWELLILLLRQNGMVVGTDIAELLVKNKNQYIWRGNTHTARSHSRRDSASSATSRSADLPVDDNHRPPSRDNIALLEADPDSSNEASLQSLTGNKKERKYSKDNSAASKPTRKTSVENSQHIQNEEKYVTDKFREYLLFGSGKDALEWAMSHGLWGHALFLASKLDRRTYANVMARFANGLLPNDPLQTLYQLMSGRQPAAVTCVLDEKWGDWRLHLAMILSNTSQRPELDKKSIMTLGDTLQARGDLYAAQFCYLMARVEFGKRPIKLQSLSNLPRLVLLGSSPSNENFSAFASNEAIMMTEIYEYACSLNDNSFVLTDFQFYKYLLATRLMDYGFYDRALFYMENIASVVSQHSAKYDFGFVNSVLQIADRLKYYDPEENIGEIVNDNVEQTENDGSAQQIQNPLSEKAWITNLRQIAHELNMSDPMHAHVPQFTNSISSQYEPVQPQFQNQYNQNWNQQQYQNYNSQLQQQQLYNQQTETDSYNQSYVQEPQYVEPHVEKATENEAGNQSQIYDPNYSQNNTSLYYTPGNAQYGDQETSTAADNRPNEAVDYRNAYHNESGHWKPDEQNQHAYGYNEPEPVKDTPLPEATDNDVGDVVEQPRPQISMPNAAKSSNASYYEDDLRDNAENGGQNFQHSASQQKPKEKSKKEDAANKSQNSSGWFGGIFNKLSLKPKNQMILPDDKNPTIVWDPEKKKWTNLDADEDEQTSQLAPPPKMPDIMKQASNLPSQNQPPPAMQQNFPTSEMGAPGPPAANTPNIFKLQKSRHIKKSYVDVFNPSGAPMRPLPPASEVLGVSQTTAAPQTYFVPQNSNDQSAQVAPSFYNPSDYAS